MDIQLLSKALPFILFWIVSKKLSLMVDPVAIDLTRVYAFIFKDYSESKG